MHFSARTALAIVPMVCLTGCLAGIPPLRADMGAGAQTYAKRPGPGGPPAGELSFRGGLFPMQLFPDQVSRTFDVGAGYGYDATDSTAMHSLFMEFDVLRPLRGSSAVFGAGVAPRVVWDAATGTTGAGAALRLSLDLARGFGDEWATDSDGATVLAAGYYGQTSLGFYVESGFVSMGPTAFATATAGITFRLPAAGFAGL